jgi:hypothetical protein
MATLNPYSGSILLDALRGSLSNAESLGRGFAVAPIGLLGDINALGREYITPRLPKRIQGLLENAPAAPSTEQILSYIPRISDARMETAGMEQLGAAMNPRGPLDAAKLAGKGLSTIGPSSGGMAPSAASQLGAYRMSTPQKVDPSVGTRFEREYLGGMAEKTPLKLEDYQGSSVMIMPWDSSSRNYKITGISDEMLANPIVTHGGQDYARDLAHIEQGIAGASNLGIAKRIRDRDAIARMENLEAGGTGEILHLPVTMGAGSENFSVMPVEALLNFADKANLSKEAIKAFDDSVREFKVFKGKGEKRRTVQPFMNFKGIMTDEGRAQMYSGEGVGSTAGELRKAIVDRFYMKGNQELFGFNAEDVSAALTDPSLIGVPKGYVGNTVILSNPNGMQLRPSANRTYNTDFTGEYQGTLGQSIPTEILMPRTFGLLSQEFAKKPGDIRNMVLGALEKRKEGVSEIVDEQMIENYYKYLADQKRKGLLD